MKALLNVRAWRLEDNFLKPPSHEPLHYITSFLATKEDADLYLCVKFGLGCCGVGRKPGTLRCWGVEGRSDQQANSTRSQQCRVVHLLRILRRFSKVYKKNSSRAVILEIWSYLFVNGRKVLASPEIVFRELFGGFDGRSQKRGRGGYENMLC